MNINNLIFYFRKKEYSKSIQQIVKMNLLEDFMKADESLQLKIGVAEMIIRFELNDMKIFYYRMSQMEKDFAHLLNKKIYSREKKMLSFLKQIAKKQAINKKSTKVNKKSTFKKYYDYILKYLV